LTGSISSNAGRSVASIEAGQLIPERSGWPALQKVGLTVIAFVRLKPYINKIANNPTVINIKWRHNVQSKRMSSWPRCSGRNLLEKHGNLIRFDTTIACLRELLMELPDEPQHIIEVGVPHSVTLPFEASDPASNVHDARSTKRFIKQNAILKRCLPRFIVWLEANFGNLIQPFKKLSRPVFSILIVLDNQQLQQMVVDWFF
jgi:hypothetical protein